MRQRREQLLQADLASDNALRAEWTELIVALDRVLRDILGIIPSDTTTYAAPTTTTVIAQNNQRIEGNRARAMTVPSHLHPSEISASFPNPNYISCNTTTPDVIVEDSRDNTFKAYTNVVVRGVQLGAENSTVEDEMNSDDNDDDSQLKREDNDDDDGGGDLGVQNARLRERVKELWAVIGLFKADRLAQVLGVSSQF